MWKFCALFIAMLLNSSHCVLDNNAGRTIFDDMQSNTHYENNVEDPMAKQLFAIIEHYKDPDPIGLPVPIPDPIEINQSVEQNINVGKLIMRDVKIYGVSQFRIQNVTVEMDRRMEATCGLEFEVLTMIGNYSLSSLFTKSNGPFNIKLYGIIVTANASLAIKVDGKVRTHEILADIQLSRMNVSFSNLGFFASMFQSFANSAGNVLFENVKPFILKDAKVEMAKAIDDNIDKIIGKYGLIPNSLSPIDYIIAEARRMVREKYDPLHINDYENPGIIGIKVFDTWIYGISSFYRVGDLTLKIINNSAIINMEIGTQETKGKTTWEVAIAKGMITRSGNVQFSVQHIKVMFTVTQPMDLGQRVKINDLQLDLGNIQIMSSGLGTVDYLIELFVNVLPNLLRYQIMDAIERPIMRKIQELADRVDVEVFIKEKYEEFQKFGTINFNLNHIEL